MEQRGVGSRLTSVTKIAAVIASLFALFPGSCGGNDERSRVPNRPSNEQALELIRSCEVKRVFFTHSGRVYLVLPDGRRVEVAHADREALENAAMFVVEEKQHCDFAIEIE
jgi:hypothetical protein